jgi:hypothetical protein
MRHKTRYVLIVSAEATMSSLTRASSHLSDIRHYFREWEEVAYIPQIPTDGDPYPRDLFGILFKSPYLDRMDIEELWRIKTPEKFELSIIELVRGLIKEGRDFDIKKIDYFTKVKERVPDEDELDGYIGTHVDSILDVLKNGMKEPVLITKSKRVIDGKHRVVTMKELGHKSIIVQYE